MDKALKGAGLGFLVCGGLAFLVATCAASSSDNEDVSNYAFLYGIAFGSFAGIIGAMIGLMIGGVVERRGRNGSSHSLKHCRHCRSPVVGNPKTCRWCGADLD